MMLRAGATEIVAVEQSELLAECAERHRRIMEWQDLRDYALKIRVGDMRSFLTADWGRFDVVTAFCSLYYLPDADMEAIVRRASEDRRDTVLAVERRGPEHARIPTGVSQAADGAQWIRARDRP